MLKKRGESDESLVKRIFSFFAPAAARDQAAMKRGLFEGTSKGSRNRYWRPSNAHINEDLGSISVLRARSRSLVRNDAWASSAIEGLVSEAIGSGIMPQATDDDEELVKRAEALWKSWGDTLLCDADGMLDFYGLQALGMKTMPEAGSFLVRRRWRRPEDNLPVPIQLQFLEPDFLDTTRDTFAPNDRGNVIMNGIELDSLGRRRGYWLFKDNPLKSSSIRIQTESVFIPASEILHVYRIDRAGQVDGVPWLAAVILRLRDLGVFLEAELVKQQVGSLHAGFITEAETPEETAELTTAEKRALQRMEPGTMTFLPPGKSVTFSTPPPTGAYKDHVPWELRAIAGAVGVTYETVTGDYSRSNFSASRMGRLRMHRNIDRWQNHIMIPRFCQPVWDWFMEAAVAAGKLPRPVGVTWSVPRREMIDPVKETAAVEKGIRIGITTLSEAIRQTGRDPADVFAERARDDAKLDELKIVVDSDPRKDSAKAPAKPNPADAEDEEENEEDEEDDEGAEEKDA